MKLFSSLLFIFFTSFLYADGIVIISPNAVGTTIGGGLGYVNLETPETESSCANHSQIRWLLSSPGGEAALSVALAAKASGKNLSVWLSGNCLDDYPVPAFLELVD